MLLKLVEDPETAYNLTSKELVSSKLFSLEKCNKIISCRSKNNNYPTYLKNFCENQKVKIISIFDSEYPQKLRSIANPPLILYVKGSLDCLKKQGIAIVGSRKATSYGVKASTLFTEELVKAGLIVISGGARGIDTSAHQTALKFGATICVLGCGIDVTYPAENRTLFQNIATNGALITEYPPHTPPLARNFPSRNRIIAGLSDGVLLVEAVQKSGSLITAEFALDEGREIYCIPGNIFTPTSKGVNHLIKQGAKLVDSPKDILLDFNLEPTLKKASEKQQSAKMENLFSSLPSEKTNAIKLIYKTLNNTEAKTLDEIIIATNLNAQTINKLLFIMLINGYIEEVSGKKYIRL
ncbi:MAG TPA: DNA-protecting protein DprA [Candidatus Avacidaminococcus intestinavium]|uniref:DNA-protecting protein DprA n=1 Tax=Candidatus Avacidaminococcus intestinavium TaxID=2840684 RepID=A0A9D1SLD6_9FIRM|nr:DNA-protecting protein DprA [Candidatus Avacidaminococcus intestinavium]